ncbi:MAG: AAA family ATPase [Blastocatellia bacterium]|nr:AAA family ATPase [Blastocatellia bacterium]
MIVVTLNWDWWNFFAHGSDSSVPAQSSDSVRTYRCTEKNLILTALQTGSSLLIVSDLGMGKSALAQFVADDLHQAGHAVALIVPTTPKQTLLDCAEQLGAEIIRDNGKQMTAAQLQTSIADFLTTKQAFLLFDDAHRLPISLRVWLLSLLDAGQPLLLFATHPPRKDIFLKLPRIELKALPHQSIRELMQTAAQELGLELTPSQFATLQERCGGNPMLARRVIRETYLGLEVTAPDHTEWMDGTPLLIAALLVFSALRFLGRGLHQTDLYLLGGFLAVAVGIARLLLASLPRKSEKLGK